MHERWVKSLKWRHKEPVIARVIRGAVLLNCRVTTWRPTFSLGWPWFLHKNHTLGTLDFKGLEHWVACEQLPHLLKQSLSSQFSLRGRGRLYTGQALGFRQLSLPWDSLAGIGSSFFTFNTKTENYCGPEKKKKRNLNLVEWRGRLAEGGTD